MAKSKPSRRQRAVADPLAELADTSLALIQEAARVDQENQRLSNELRDRRRLDAPGPEQQAVMVAVAYRAQSQWQPPHDEHIVGTVLSVIATGEWKQFLEGGP